MGAAGHLVFLLTFGGTLCWRAERASAAPPANAGTGTDRPHALSLVYDAPASCPSREELLAAVEARRPPHASRAADVRTFVVRLRASPRGGFDATLEVAHEGEAPTTREVRAASCSAAMTSIAVFITLALAPTDALASAGAGAASIDGGAANGPLSSPPDDAAPPPAAGESGLSRPRGGPSEHVRSRAVSSPMSTSPSETPSAPASIVWTGGASVVTAGLGAQAIGARVSGELSRLPASTSPGIALRLSWGWADFSVSPPPAGEARFRLRTTRAEPCLVLPWDRLSISACGAAELGTLSATAAGLPVNGRASMGWVAAGASARVRIHVVHGLALEAGTAALAPFTRRPFALAEPVRTVFRPAPVLVEASLGIQMSATF